MKEPGHLDTRAFLVCLWLVMVWLFANPKACYSWYTPMHGDITREALDHAPFELKSALAPYREKILWNSMAPDVVLQDWPHHEWNVHRGPEDETDAPEYISLLANGLIFYLQSPDHNMEEAARVFGLISHYLADINQPLHTDDYLNDNQGVHFAYESDVYHSEDRFYYQPRGYAFWSDVRDMVKASALHANLYYAAIMDAYASGKGLEGVSRITRLCYDHAVSDIIDLWSTIWFTAMAEEPVHLALKLNQPYFISGEMAKILITSMVTRPCLSGDLYVELRDSDGNKKYLGENGTLCTRTAAFKKGWKPLSRDEGLEISLPVSEEMAGRDFTLSVFVAVRGSDPHFYGALLSNICKLELRVNPLPDSVTKDIADEPYLFTERSVSSGVSKDVLLHRWDLIFLGEKKDNPLTEADESLLNRLIPGKFRHVMLYLGRDGLGRPVTVEYQGSKGLVLARLPEGDAPYKSFYGKLPVSIKDIFAYQNRKAKRLNPIDLGLVEEHESKLLNQIDVDFFTRLPYQFEYVWSGDFSDKAVHLVDDGRANGVSCTDYFLDLFETNATVCIHGSRMKAREIEDYYLHDPDGINAAVPDKWNPFPITVTAGDIIRMGFHLVNPPPHAFSCDDSTETGLPVPARLVDSQDLVDIEGVGPVFSPK